MWRTTGGVCPKLPNRQKFQSTSPVWRTTRPRSKSSLRTWISIHAPRVEDDSESARQPRNTIAFQSTSPVWRTTDGYEIAFESSPISIHVPRVEDDTTRSKSSANITNFNPRPPCGGRLRKLDLLRGRGRFQSTSPVWRTTGEHYEAYRQKHRFQSTSPVWRTTQSSRRGRGGGNHFNPRPPCGGRPNPDSRKRSKERFQSTSPVWRTTPTVSVSATYRQFQSTSPVWRTTQSRGRGGEEEKISIHVPRVEDDKIPQEKRNRSIYFNPRPPCGGRLERDIMDCMSRYFNPRPPCGGRLELCDERGLRLVFQSTSPVWRTTFS